MTQPSSDGQRQPAIVILDFGSQYSELIARRVRETEVFSVVLGYSTSAEELRAMQPKGIILSGGPSSVYAEHAPLCDPAIWDLGIPVLGVCYGMQLMVQQLGGVVEAATGKAEYGKAPLEVDDPTDLLTNVTAGSTMWMSHGDSVKALPEGLFAWPTPPTRLRRQSPTCNGASTAFSSIRKWCTPPAAWP